MPADSPVELPKKRRAPSKNLDSRTFKDGAIYLYRRAEYVKPIWFIRLKVPNVKGYIWKSSGTTDEHSAYGLAENLFNQTLGKVHAGINVKSKRIGSGLDAFLKSYEERPSLSVSEKHTVTLAKRIQPTFQTRTFADLDTPMVADMLETIAKLSKRGRLSPNTIKRTHTHLKLMMNWWVDHGFLAKAPAFPKLSAQKKRRPHFDKRDWNKLTRHMREFTKVSHGPVKRDRMLLVNYALILANTGIRVGEARILKWRDIRPINDNADAEKSNVALLVKGKTGMRETVARTGEVKRYFARILELRRADLANEKSDIYKLKDVPLDSYVFCGLNGKPIGSFKKSFNSLIESAGVTADSFGERRTIYSLRHTYATFRLQEGVNQYVLAKNMGTSVAMLEDYYGHTTNVGMVDELTKSRSAKRIGEDKRSVSALSWLEKQT
jgi:integrase|tara:strand:+ start:147 stop:1454 length:1308 start_codon:yes stop_codon:yes gene_type:complete